MLEQTHNKTRSEFPFAAVVGQQEFKLALVLVAINPTISGVVISGPRGCAKSTLARGLAELLPAQNAASFVTLPLGATEEMLLGTLSLDKVLNSKELAFHPGLLSKAHQGVLYVDEVNLLPDNLVDLLLDVAASGINHVERDGISHQHAAEFLLIGTMNPDEGELRPQLHDRFGLCVELDNQFSIEERVEIVQARDAFDLDPEGYSARYEQAQLQLTEKILNASKALPHITCSDALRLDIAKRCVDANVDGLRADIVWYRTALAHAAWVGRDAVSAEDIDAVAELVLRHRRSARPSPPPGPTQSPSDEGRRPASNFKRPDDSHKHSANQNSQTQAPQPQTQSADGSELGDWGSMPSQHKLGIATLTDALGELLPIEKAQQSLRVTNPPSADFSNNVRRGDRNGRRDSLTWNHSPDWFATLLANIGEWPPERLRFRKNKSGQTALHVVLFDTSASTLQGDVFAFAKGALAEIARKAYLKREQLAVFGFGNNEIKPLLAKVRAPKQISAWLETISAAGGTPMQKGLDEMFRYTQTICAQNTSVNLTNYIISDGRTRADLTLSKASENCVWIDTEQADVPRGKGRFFAEQLGAVYISIQQELTHLKNAPVGVAR